MTELVWLLVMIVRGQILDVCETDSCRWSPPSNDRIIVCLRSANKCEIICNDGYCQGLIVYNLAESLYIQCDQTNSCRHMTVM